MIARIAPLVEMGQRRLRASHVLGGLVGAALIATPLACISAALATASDSSFQSTRLAVGGIVLLAASAIDLGVLSRPRRGITDRQTPGSMTCVFGPQGGAFVWGVDLGAVWTTRPPFIVILAFPICFALILPPAAVAVALLAFGCARAGATAIAASLPDSINRCSNLAARKSLMSWGAGLMGLVAVAATCRLIALV